jgi:hypothetical protein
MYIHGDLLTGAFGWIRFKLGFLVVVFLNTSLFSVYRKIYISKEEMGS